MTEYAIDRTSDVLRSGVAKIITNVGAGVYTITEQWRTAGGANQNATAPVGRVNISAREINALTAGAADDIVRFWEAQKIDGTIETLIDIGIDIGDDKYVKTDSNDTTADYLDAKLDATAGAGITAADHWVIKKVLPVGALQNNHVTLNHNDACSASCATVTIQGAGSVSGSGTVTFDAKGHGNVSSKCITLTGTNSDEKVKVCAGDTAAYLEDQVDGDGTWITVANDTGKMKTSHIGPECCSTAYAPITASWCLSMCSPEPVFDSRGHIMGWLGMSAGSLCSWWSPWGCPRPTPPFNCSRP